MGIVSRRGFIQAMAAAVAAASVLEVDDPERLLWRPGEKTIFLPPAKEIVRPQEAAAREIMRELEKPRIIAPAGGRYRVKMSDGTDVRFDEKWRPLGKDGRPLSDAAAAAVTRRVFHDATQIIGSRPMSILVG